MFNRERIIAQAVGILGATQHIHNAGNKFSTAEKICDAFVPSAVEEVWLAVTWPEGIVRIPKTPGKDDEFTSIKVPGFIKLLGVAPANTEWYYNEGEFCFKCHTAEMQLDSAFYYSKNILKGFLQALDSTVSASFINLCALKVASQASNALYSDSIVTEGFVRQYHQRIEELKRLNKFDFHVQNGMKYNV